MNDTEFIAGIFITNAPDLTIAHTINHLIYFGSLHMELISSREAQHKTENAC